MDRELIVSQELGWIPSDWLAPEDRDEAQSMFSLVAELRERGLECQADAWRDNLALFLAEHSLFRTLRWRWDAPDGVLWVEGHRRTRCFRVLPWRLYRLPIPPDVVELALTLESFVPQRSLRIFHEVRGDIPLVDPLLVVVLPLPGHQCAGLILREWPEPPRRLSRRALSDWRRWRIWRGRFER